LVGCCWFGFEQAKEGWCRFLPILVLVLPITPKMKLNKITQIRTVDGILENQEEKEQYCWYFFEFLPLIFFN
jgi:hypothetical protein